MLVLLTFLGLFCFENIPSTLIICGIIAQIAHLSLLSSFPFFSATSPSFIVAVVMVIVNHYFAFSHFGENYYPFSEVMAYFTICMWLVPFAFFVSLSANENVLPTLGERRHLMAEDNDIKIFWCLSLFKIYLDVSWVKFVEKQGVLMRGLLCSIFYVVFGHSIMFFACVLWSNLLVYL